MSTILWLIWYHTFIDTKVIRIYKPFEISIQNVK